MPASNRTQQKIDHPNRTTTAENGKSPACVGDYMGRMTQLAKDNPTTAVMTVFAVGLGVGAVIGGIIAGQPPGSRSSTIASKAEDMGKRIAAAVTDLLPDALTS